MHDPSRQLLACPHSAMSRRLQRYAPLLALLARATPPIRRAVLRGNDPGLLQCLCECVKNVLNGNVPLTRAHKTRLQRYKTGLRTLVKKSVPLHKKGRIVQRGGFLGALLAPLAASVIGSILTPR